MAICELNDPLAAPLFVAPPDLGADECDHEEADPVLQEQISFSSVLFILPNIYHESLGS